MRVLVRDIKDRVTEWRVRSVCPHDGFLELFGVGQQNVLIPAHRIYLVKLDYREQSETITPGVQYQSENGFYSLTPDDVLSTERYTPIDLF